MAAPAITYIDNGDGTFTKITTEIIDAAFAAFILNNDQADLPIITSNVANLQNVVQANPIATAALSALQPAIISPAQPAQPMPAQT